MVIGVVIAPSRGRGLKPPDDLERHYRLEIAPSRGRGLKHGLRGDSSRLCHRPFTGARIETSTTVLSLICVIIAPSRGRGLKPQLGEDDRWYRRSPLHGGAD